MGAFVCLKTKGELKGCIGYIRGQMPLDETIRQMAVEAAFHDPRFVPLDAVGMGGYGYRDIGPHADEKDNRHRARSRSESTGSYIEKGFDSGLLLPQVATENGWDRKVFLEYACMKAGLPRDAWKSRRREYTFFRRTYLGLEDAFSRSRYVTGRRGLFSH